MKCKIFELHHHLNARLLQQNGSLLDRSSRSTWDRPKRNRCGSSASPIRAEHTTKHRRAV
ncbi:hypothetical protein KFK09_015452 [Dendrobium nobile]|uniref:Uncharacterized protein n=1 Tax=Dendrobium nobile TaxID=94219 RepID=A0A8T3B4U6_DENNO|nr:hypothetical protein KFK09_015452 [Dendrobium nobile]